MNGTLKFKFLETWGLNFCRLNIILDYSIEKMSRNYYIRLKKYYFQRPFAKMVRLNLVIVTQF